MSCNECAKRDAEANAVTNAKDNGKTNSSKSFAGGKIQLHKAKIVFQNALARFPCFLRMVEIYAETLV